MEEGRKYPFEITITPEEVERGRHWITARLTNIATESISDVSATLYTYNSYNIDVLPSGSFHFVREMQPQETKVMNFHIFANHSGRVYLHVTGYRNDNLIGWYSPDYEIRIAEDPAEIQTFFVNRPYWAYEETIETETVVKARADVRDLRLEIAAKPPSKNHTLLDVIDIDFIAKGGTKRYVSEIFAIEEGTYLLSARLFHDNKLISSKEASCYVAPFEE